MSLGDVKRLPRKDVEKYYNRYQIIMGNQLTGTLVNTSIEVFTGIANYLLPIDDKTKLCSDLKDNPLIN